MLCSMYTNGWDVADEGVTAVFDRLERSGLNGILLATSYHAGRFLLPHNPKRKVYILEDGTVYFEPGSNRYGTIMPRRNSLLNQLDMLRAAEDESAKRNMRVSSWTVLLHNTPLGSQHPDVAIVNAFGDRYVSSLSPAHPDARTYIVNLCGDLTHNHDLNAIELESYEYMGFEHDYHHEKIGIQLTPLLNFLLSLDFNPAHAPYAEDFDVDMQEIRTYVRTTINEIFNGDIQSQGSDALGELRHALNGTFQKFFDMRCHIVTTLLKDIVQAAEGTDTIIRPMFGPDAAECYWSGIDLKATGKLVREVAILAYVREPDAVDGIIQDYRDHLSSVCRLSMGFSLFSQFTDSAENLREKVRICKNRNIESLNFYNYGLMAPYQFDWIAAALK